MGLELTLKGLPGGSNLNVGSLRAAAAPALERLLSLVHDHPRATVGAGALLCYVALCNALRMRSLRRLQARYPCKTREDLGKLTNEQAYEIQLNIFQMEFPFTALKALQFALFRTYGIPTISRLLVQTKQLSDTRYAPKRYTDTEVLIQQFVTFHPQSVRANAAIARTNYLHSLYRKSGKISNGDLLYTLALFALEPKRFINRYEWRELSDLEICALGTFWKSVGDGFEISYEELPSFPNGWKDGIQWFEEVEAWSEAYEKKYMVPDEDNKKTADETTKMLLWDIPAALHPFGYKAVAVLMNERLRRAMMYPDPPEILTQVINAAFGIRAFVLRYFSLPRPEFMRIKKMSDEANEHGKYYMLQYDVDPWYIEPTFRNRWGLQALWKRLIGKPIPGSEGFRSDGYSTDDVGPKNFEGKGKDFVDENTARLIAQGRGGCPFAFSKS